MSKRITIIFLFLVVVLSFLDLFATWYWIKKGLALEANPLLAHQLESFWGFASLKMGLTITGSLVLARHQENLFAQVGSGLALGVYVAVILWHLFGFFVSTQ